MHSYKLLDGWLKERVGKGAEPRYSKEDGVRSTNTRYQTSCSQNLSFGSTRTGTVKETDEWGHSHSEIEAKPWSVPLWSFLTRTVCTSYSCQGNSSHKPGAITRSLGKEKVSDHFEPAMHNDACVNGSGSLDH